MSGPWDDFQSPATVPTASPDRPPWVDFQPSAEAQRTPAPSLLNRAVDAVKQYGPRVASKVADYVSNPFVAGATDAGKWVANNPTQAYNKVGPWLPAAGGVAGSLMFPGLGSAIGAGAGEIARQAAGVVVQDPKVMATITPGSNFSPQAGISAAAQAGLGGLNEVNGLAKAAPEALPYAQRTVNAAGTALAPVGNAIKRGVARMSETFTGVPARQAVKLIDEPGRLVSGIGQINKLGQDVGAAESVSEAGLPPAMRAKITTNQGGAADEIVSSLLEKKYTNPDAITPLEATAGIKAIDATMPNFTKSNAKIIQEYADLRSTLSGIQAKADPNLASAKAAYSDAKVGGDYRNVFRQTKAGHTSVMPFLASVVNPAVEIGRHAAAIAGFSPALWGTGMVMGSVASKVAGAAVSNPTARQALVARYLSPAATKIFSNIIDSDSTEGQQ